MRKIRTWIRAFFGFSQGQTNGFLLLIPFILLALFSEPLYRAWWVRQPVNHTADQRKLDSLWGVIYAESDADPDAPSTLPPETFSFDPNTATLGDWQRLGFAERVAQRIINYRSKGGTFRSAADVKNIYGIDTARVAQLSPWMTFARTREKTPPVASSHTRENKPPARHERFDLNTCDSLQLLSVNGLGPVLSSRILRYRTRLGGFVSPGQLYEVYGLDSATITALRERSFIEASFQPLQINLNTATEQELKKLPYIRPALAKAITTWRFQHTKFASVNDLLKLKQLDSATFHRIKPYLTVSAE
ncbi:MAG: helix-hairpin-helix domain-containing protein [Cyclobacteriaceae bacterium]|jgi:DNA uptake protein ComE-like DNA-binding protein|nr:helix-hairpin-helix domain-containing protein [Cyclobacteriaceae bacterium]